MSAPMIDVVVATDDVVGSKMAGPGIRAWHLAEELSRHFRTALVAKLEDAGPLGGGFEMIDLSSPAARSALRSGRVVVGQPSDSLLRLAGGGAKVAFDLFAPGVLELRELYGGSPTLRQRVHYAREMQRLRAALRRGRVLIAAMPRQKSFYAGVAAAPAPSEEWNGRWVYVPFGVPPEGPPEGTENLGGDPVIVWGGGVWHWLAPDVAVEAVLRLNEEGTACRLLFLGTRRPNEAARRAETGARLRDLVDRAGDRIIWNREWVPYRERSRWLGAARAAVMLHRSTLEAEHSIRTRFFDALWCGVPVVASAGGFAAELVESEGLGVTLARLDAAGAAEALGRLLRDDDLHAGCVLNISRVRRLFRWDEVTRPLVDRIGGLL
jgi:glycosyltransferase involved in cell wall biosynthesis